MRGGPGTSVGASPAHGTRDSRTGRPTGRPQRPSPSERFRTLDRYRVDREWVRYEGTPQRDLFRELRERFLSRHRVPGGWAVDVGAGPGRFSASLGDRPSGRVLMDVSREMLLSARRTLSGQRVSGELVLADARSPPLRAGRFTTVAALGNPVGFAEEDAGVVLTQILSLVAEGGMLLLEVVCGPGERSRYLARLPPGALRRLLAAPVNLVVARAEREGFRREVARAGSSGFRRFPPKELIDRLVQAGFEVRETLAVAPAVGSDPERVAAVRPDPLAWLHLLEAEEKMGRSPARHASAAALLVAASRRRRPDAPAEPPRDPPRMRVIK